MPFSLCRILLNSFHLSNSSEPLYRSSSYDRLVNNTKRSFGETLSRASLSDVHRGARKADRSKCLSSALGTVREAFLEITDNFISKRHKGASQQPTANDRPHP